MQRQELAQLIRAAALQVQVQVLELAMAMAMVASLVQVALPRVELQERSGQARFVEHRLSVPRQRSRQAPSPASIALYVPASISPRVPNPYSDPRANAGPLSAQIIIKVLIIAKPGVHSGQASNAP